MAAPKILKLKIRDSREKRLCYSLITSDLQKAFMYLILDAVVIGLQ